MIYPYTYKHKENNRSSKTRFILPSMKVRSFLSARTCYTITDNLYNNSKTLWPLFMANDIYVTTDEENHFCFSCVLQEPLTSSPPIL